MAMKTNFLTRNTLTLINLKIKKAENKFLALILY